MTHEEYKNICFEIINSYLKIYTRRLLLDKSVFRFIIE